MWTSRLKRVLLFLLALLAFIVSCGARAATPAATRRTVTGEQGTASVVASRATLEQATAASEITLAASPSAGATPAEPTPAPTSLPCATASLAPQASSGTSFYVAPDGSPDGDGSLARPWDLATALAQPAAVQPGDTIWLRGGAYSGIFRSDLTGLPNTPITVRSYPREWAVIDTQAQTDDGDNFIVQGSWANYRDLELTNTRTSNRSGSGFVFAGNSQHNKFVNMIIHDLGNNTFRDGNEIYGSILYNNGVDGSGNAHQLYTQNDDPGNPVRIVDSIVFNGFAFGMHAYAGGVGQLRGIQMIGSVWFNSGAAQSETGYRKDNILVGGVNGAEEILLQENMTWAFSGRERNVALGRYYEQNGAVTLLDNYLVGEDAFYNTWQPATMADNTFFIFDGGDSNVDAAHFPDNEYRNTPPHQNRVFIRPNIYEPGRAHIVVYNWELRDSVQIDLRGLLLEGDSYEVRNAQNYFAPPVAAGTYQGQPVTLRLAGLQPAQPIGPGLIEPSEYTGKSFNVFVLLRTGSAPAATVFMPIVSRR